MFGHVYKRATEWSNHYLDWSRFGELLVSDHHKYSRDEILIRGVMIGCGTVSAMLGYYYNDKEKTQCADLTFAVISGFVGFTISHIIAISPLILKRLQMQWACDDYIAQIHTKLDKKVPPVSAEGLAIVKGVIDKIYALSLSNDKHANASLTWGERKRLFGVLCEYIDDSEFNAGSLPKSMTVEIGVKKVLLLRGNEAAGANQSEIQDNNSPGLPRPT